MSNRTVFGVPLEDGERVVYFRRNEPGWQKPALIVVGLLTAFAFLGLFFLAAGIMATTQCWVVTNRRVMVLTRKKTEQIRVNDIARMRWRDRRGRTRWVWLERATGNEPWLAIQRVEVPDLIPILQQLDADRTVVERMPEVPFEADNLPKKKVPRALPGHS